MDLYEESDLNLIRLEIRVFLLLDTVCLLYPLVHSQGHSPICIPQMQVVAIVPSRSADRHSTTSP